MSTSPDHSPVASSPDRIALRSATDVGSFVDGGWWPDSLDLVAQLPALLLAGEAAGYRPARRVSFALTSWDGPTPRHSTMLDRVVKLGGFRSQDPAELSLIDSSGWRRMTLVVVPPGTDPAVARRALELASTDGDRHRAAEILDLAHQAQ